MRRADRLFQIVQYLRAGRLLTARTLAERLEVSERTIYRDIADLQMSGVPVDGEAGIGYLMREGYDLPPLMFSRDEVSALIVGARMVGAWGGAKMALASETALSKIDNVLPDDMKGQARTTPVFAFDHQMPAELKSRFDEINQAILEQSVLAIEYRAAEDETSQRQIEPLGLYYWGRTWTLASWCQLRQDFRTFRIDRITAMTPTGEKTKAAKGKTLRDFLVSQSRSRSSSASEVSARFCVSDAGIS
jgi:predicted DNA-binding transcriptional regulator YafY